MTKTFFDPIHETPFYKKNFKHKTHLPKTMDISKRILSLPIYPTMTKEELNYVSNTIFQFFKKL